MAAPKTDGSPSLTTRTLPCGLSREICKICYKVNRVGFHVPDEIWRAVVPGQFGNSVVCLGCFMDLADEKLIPWDKAIVFHPVSLRTHLGVE